MLGYALLSPRIAQAQSVDHGPHRLGLQLGLGPFFAGIDEDGHHKDKGLGVSGTFDYGYLSNQHFEAGGVAKYWSTETAADAFLVGGRVRGIITFGKRHTGELGFEAQAGYLGMIVPRISDDRGSGRRTHFFSGFALSGGIDGSAWVNDHWGYICGGSFTLGKAGDTSDIPGFYLPSSGGMLSLEGRCGVRVAL